MRKNSLCSSPTLAPTPDFVLGELLHPGVGDLLGTGALPDHDGTLSTVGNIKSQRGSWDPLGSHQPQERQSGLL